jgi:hypothetical protein
MWVGCVCHLPEVGTMVIDELFRAIKMTYMFEGGYHPMQIHPLSGKSAGFLHSFLVVYGSPSQIPTKR